MVFNNIFYCLLKQTSETRQNVDLNVKAIYSSKKIISDGARRNSGEVYFFLRKGLVFEFFQFFFFLKNSLFED